MGVEHVALWQIHRPDMLTHPSEIARALTVAHQAGKIGAVGVSNFTPSQVEALAMHLPFPIVSCQPEFSPLAIGPLTNGVLDQAIARDMTVLAWSPLGQGRLGDPKDDRARAVAAALDVKAAGLRCQPRRRGLQLDHGPSGPADPDRRHPDPRADRRDPRRLQTPLDPGRLVPGPRRLDGRASAMTRKPCEISWFSALCDDDYEFLGVPDPMLRSSWEHCRDIVMQAEAGGFDNILLPSGYELGLDTTAFAAGIAPLLKRMRL